MEDFLHRFFVIAKAVPNRLQFRYQPYFQGPFGQKFCVFIHGASRVWADIFFRLHSFVRQKQRALFFSVVKNGFVIVIPQTAGPARRSLCRVFPPGHGAAGSRHGKNTVKAAGVREMRPCKNKNHLRIGKDPQVVFSVFPAVKESTAGFSNRQKNNAIKNYRRALRSSSPDLGER